MPLKKNGNNCNLRLRQLCSLNLQRKDLSPCQNPKDNKYLELALSGQAECIVTGDNDLLVLTPFRGIAILTIQEFLAKN